MKEIRSLLMSLLLICIFVSANAQPDCNQGKYPPLPAMYVKEDVSEQYKQEFQKAGVSKYQLLQSLNCNPDIESIFTRKAVDDLLTSINKEDGIRIYFAQYSNCAGSVLPASVNNGKLIVLFATEHSATGATAYYFLNQRDDHVYPVAKQCGDKWVADYKSKILPVLASTIQPNDPDNIDPTMPATPKLYTDTKSIFFKAINITEAFTKEPAYQASRKQPVNIVGYKLVLSAYTATGNPNDGNKFKQRLFIQFDYLVDKGNGWESLNLEEQEEYICRRDAPASAKVISSSAALGK
ncbi:MAG: hypothetical protein EOO88_52040, partial [Pedobacter sp.]